MALSFVKLVPDYGESNTIAQQTCNKLFQFTDDRPTINTSVDVIQVTKEDIDIDSNIVHQKNKQCLSLDSKGRIVTWYGETPKYDSIKKEDYEEERLNHPKRRKRNNGNRKNVMFSETVTVITIPMRNEYSHQIRSKLWSSPIELQQNATRNAIEFASEGWNWRTVVEDELMYVCGISGELIHPCHVDANYDINNTSPSLSEP